MSHESWCASLSYGLVNKCNCSRSHERTLDEQLIMLRLAARVDPLLREAVADVDDAVATLIAEQESLARLLGEMMADQAALRTALEDCLHRLGNMWGRLDVPVEEWPRLKQEAAAGIGNTGNGNEYAWKLNWLAYERGREALGGKS